MRSCEVHVRGVVQGVGFRPFVWKLARDLGVAGWIRNSSSGVDALVEGDAQAVSRFLTELTSRPPALARVDEVKVREVARQDWIGFEIMPSHEERGAFVPVSVDVATCPDCIADIGDPGNRRYRYPFTNCTNCGPRFTIVRDIPYDRPRTTMAGFPLCSECRAEYENPADRRFHAQPVACPNCGPQLTLEVDDGSRFDRDAALHAARELLMAGGILAIKGLGGYHLACDALQADAVAELRRRKHREQKPLALMVANLELAERYVVLDEASRAVLVSRERPIVLLPRAHGSALPDEIAPGLRELGVMLPYTPLHELLMEPAEGFSGVLVLTSGNLSDEPIAYLDHDARERLAPLVDAMLIHDRPIHTRCDDSVVSVVRGQLYPVRRSRGYAPSSLALPWSSTAGLAVGAELKNTFGLLREGEAFLSHHIGDLEHLSALESLNSGIAHFRELYRVEPRWIAHDLHPGYHSTRIAQDLARTDGVELLGIQHHHAHTAAVMAEWGLGLEERVLGVTLDGTGYGEDGTIWGGEFLDAGFADFSRAGKLRPMQLPGGDAAIRKPYRIALAYLRELGLEWAADLPPVRESTEKERAILGSMQDISLNCPRTSSMGRLFDAVASLLGLCHRAAYEAQGPRLLEALASPISAGYEMGTDGGVLDFAPALQAIVEDLGKGVERQLIASRFHRGLADAVVRLADELARERGLHRIALSGGSWQNRLLLETSRQGFEKVGLEVLVHRRVPTNDGGIALGQLAIASARVGVGTSGVQGDT